MGKAEITENKGGGLYAVTLMLKDGDGETVDAWCADYTDDIEVGATVGTIEIDGVGLSIIKPGFVGAAWDSSDGILADPTKATPSGFFWNAALTPAWQKFRPTARECTIISINAEAGTASVCLKPATGPLGVPLEPDDLPECDLYDAPEAEDPNIAQLADFCERHPDHPACQPVTERTTISHAAFWNDIVQVNTAVNEGITYTRDVGGDVWDVVSLPGSGDCEDYALTKMQMLADLGVPASAMGVAVGKIGSGPVRGAQDADHAWAVVFTDRGMFHLEQSPNIPKQTRPAQNTRILRYQQPYEFIARRLDDVPIEYMDCNAAAFTEGDDVVVAFEGQSWDGAKIVGFTSAPSPCSSVWVPMVLWMWTTQPDSEKNENREWAFENTSVYTSPLWCDGWGRERWSSSIFYKLLPLWKDDDFGFVAYDVPHQYEWNPLECQDLEDRRIFLKIGDRNLIGSDGPDEYDSEIFEGGDRWVVNYSPTLSRAHYPVFGHQLDPLLTGYPLLKGKAAEELSETAPEKITGIDRLSLENIRLVARVCSTGNWSDKKNWLIRAYDLDESEHESGKPRLFETEDFPMASPLSFYIKGRWIELAHPSIQFIEFPSDDVDMSGAVRAILWTRYQRTAPSEYPEQGQEPEPEP